MKLLRNSILVITMLVAGCGSSTAPVAAGSAALTTPDFGPNVLILDPSMPDPQAQVDAIFRKQERNQFGTDRYAILFKPGQYNLDAQVGFYTQILGLGESPDDVTITGAVRAMAGWMGGNATCNFWRSAENLAIVPTQNRNTDVWAVSQATDLRRVHVKGSLNLWDGGWSSGGFLADSKIDGQVTSGSQQQWLSRNNDWGRWEGGNWNMVFVGDRNAPTETWPQQPYTVVDQTPVIQEKPYLYVDRNGRFFVKVPALHTTASEGISWSSGSTGGASLPIDRFYVALPDKDNAASINLALRAGKNLLLTPGVYHLESSIQVTRPEQVVLGLGYATLEPDRGTPAMVVSDVNGIKVGGLILQAGPASSSNLLEIGPPGSHADHSAAPSFFYDISCRVGGASPGQASCMVTVNSRNVVGDNVWLWRADHGRGVGWDSNKSETGLTVNGDDVTFYGLFVEHTQGYQTVWNGNGGRVYFYQSEMPYDPPSQAEWKHGSVNGYASYKVADTVRTHEAWGVGIYSYFIDAPVVSDDAIEIPDAPGVKIHHVVTIRLGGQSGSGIAHILNGTGAPVINRMKAELDRHSASR